MKRNTIIIILFAVLTALLITYFFFGRKTKKSFSWRETYKADSDQPYGTTFIRQLLETYRPGQEFIYNDKAPIYDLLTQDSAVDADYVFIGSELWLSDDDCIELLRFIASGNDAFVATNQLPFQLIDSVFRPECDNRMFTNEHNLETATLNFYNQSLRTPKGFSYTYKEYGRTRKYKWSAVQPGVFCDSAQNLVALGHLDNDAVNFIRLPYGEGNLYIHTNPIAFTNYFIRMPDKADYAASVFSHLDGKTIIWDEFSRSELSEEKKESNPLALIMRHDSLKYAWWLMLVSVVLYTAFTAKRRQRIVPVREEKTNTSLEYVKMVSALHFRNGNHRDIVLKKMKYFLYFVRAKYGMNTTQFSSDQIKRLAEKSQIGLKEVESIFDQYTYLEKSDYVSHGQLMNLYNAIDYFYKHCK